MDQLEGTSLVKQDGTEVLVSAHLKDIKVLVYLFSASMVNYVSLLDILKTVYEENIKRNTKLEFIYVSADQEENNFWNDFKTHGPWVAIPFKHTVGYELRWLYNITCLPQVIVVKKNDGLIISKIGKQELEKIGINVLITWTEYTQ